MPALPLLAGVSARLPSRGKTTNSKAEADTVESYLWARATAADGQTAHPWARTSEGYRYTARAAVLTVEATLGSKPLGATTVARAFGPELSFAAGSEILAAV